MATIKKVKAASKGDATKRATKTAKSDAPFIAPPAKKETAEPAEVKASKYKGRTTGMRVMEFQDATFAANVKTKLTDEELVALWRAEFPEAVAFTVFHVKGARRDYNAGTHSKGAAKPETPLAEVVMVDGKRQFVGAKTEAPVAVPAAEVTTKKARAKKAA